MSLWTPPPPWDPEERAAKDPLAHRGCQILGERIRRRRYQAGYSQRKLGELCGVPQSTISRLENGKLRGISLPKLGRLVAALGGL